MFSEEFKKFKFPLSFPLSWCVYPTLATTSINKSLQAEIFHGTFFKTYAFKWKVIV